MFGDRAVRDLVIFVTFYLLLSFPPFLYFNPGTLRTVSTLAMIAVIGTGVMAIIATLLLLDKGVDRHLQSLVTPSDLPSVIVELVFVMAAVSWWVVPQLNTIFEWGLELELVVVVVLGFHLPLVLIMSLLTALSQVRD